MKKIIFLLLALCSFLHAEESNIPEWGWYSWRAPVSNFGALPGTNNNLGDVIFVDSALGLYYWTGTSWAALGGGGGGGISTINGDGTAAQVITGTAPISASSSAGTTTIALSTPVTESYGGTGTATNFTSGSVVFEGTAGTYMQDNANLFYDSTNLGLAVGDPNVSYSMNGSTYYNRLKLHSQSVGNIIEEVINKHSSTAGQVNSQMAMSRSRGTETSPTAVIQNDYLGQIFFNGYDGATYRQAGYILGQVTDATPSSTSFQGALKFYTTPTGSTTPILAATIDGTQNMTLAHPLPTGSGGTGLNSLGTGVSSALGIAVNNSGGISTVGGFVDTAGLFIAGANTGPTTSAFLAQPVTTTINSDYSVCYSGTGTASFSICSAPSSCTPVGGLSSVSIGQSLDTTAATSAFTMSAGNFIQVVTNSTTNCLVGVKYTR